MTKEFSPTPPGPGHAQGQAHARAAGDEGDDSSANGTDWRALGDASLLAALLAVGPTPAATEAKGRARAWLRRRGGWRSAAGRGEGGDPVDAVVAAALELARRYHRADLEAGPGLTSPRQSAAYLQAELRDRPQEVFACLFLDTRHRVLAFEELFRGSIDGACVYPRVVAERALALGAAAVIAAHNHPSGVAEPSLSDQAITHRLRDALGLIDVRLLDHFVIGAGRPVSLAERGLV